MESLIVGILPKILIAAIVIAVLAIIASGYVKAPPNRAFIISGFRSKLLSGKLNDAPSGRLFRADFRTLQMCQSL